MKLRNDEGQYAVALGRPCVCGCLKGQHDAGAKGRSVGACQGCDKCLKFKASNTVSMSAKTNATKIAKYFKTQKAFKVSGPVANEGGMLFRWKGYTVTLSFVAAGSSSTEEYDIDVRGPDVRDVHVNGPHYGMNAEIRSAAVNAIRG
jgi:hypothetical protein